MVVTLGIGEAQSILPHRIQVLEGALDNVMQSTPKEYAFKK